MRVPAGLVLVLCAACYAPSPHPGAPCPDGVCPSGLVCASATQTCELSESSADAAIGEGDDAMDAMLATGDGGPTCYGGGLVSICPVAPITAPLAITTNTTIDTASSPLCIEYSGGAENAYCVIAATTISIAANRRLRAQGARPLVVLATGAITVEGTLDVSAGAATNPFACVPPTAATGAQGGAGGSYRGRGGAGAGAVNGLGPASAPATTTVAFRGGCDGGKGAGGGGGVGGNGGGAMYLIGASISVNGALTAGGSGGSQGTNASGGGGGGAGGFIGLDSQAITVAGRVVANGGGGGEGATPNHGGNGGSTGSSSSAASGGSGGANHGGDGGSGSAGMSLAGSDGRAGGTCGRNGASGGGGGGGAGMIYVFPTQTLGGSISPPPG